MDQWLMQRTQDRDVLKLSLLSRLFTFHAPFIWIKSLEQKEIPGTVSCAKSFQLRGQLLRMVGF